jgi:transcriptional regulator with XRE-family HTH domain
MYTQVQKTELMKATRQLRTAMGLTQTAFAQRVGKTLPTIQRYETLAQPRGEVLVKLMKLADEHGHADLAELFQDALSTELGYRVPRLAAAKSIEVLPGEEADFDALRTILRGGKFYAGTLEEWRKISQPVKERNVGKDYRAIRDSALVLEVWRRVGEGQSDHDIALALGISDDSVQNIRTAQPKEKP